VQNLNKNLDDFVILSLSLFDGDWLMFFGRMLGTLTRDQLGLGAPDLIWFLHFIPKYVIIISDYQV
jgi:hypothetical protein